MNKQDVYIPISVEDFNYEGDSTAASVPLMIKSGMVHQTFVFELKSYLGRDAKVLQPLKQVYVLTEDELNRIVADRVLEAAIKVTRDNY